MIQHTKLRENGRNAMQSKCGKSWSFCKMSNEHIKITKGSFVKLFPFSLRKSFLEMFWWVCVSAENSTRGSLN